MQIKYGMLWLPGALFTDERKGVARLEREGTRYSRAVTASFRGRQWEVQWRKEHHSFPRPVDSLEIGLLWEPLHSETPP